MFAVMVLKKEIGVSVLGRVVEIPFSTAGMIGMIPVYETRKEAEKEWPGRPIIEIGEKIDPTN